MKALGRLFMVLGLLGIGALVVWFAFARPAVQGASATQEQLAAAQTRASKAESRVKNLEANPIVKTEIVTKTVEVVKEVPVVKIVEKVVEGSATNIGAQVPMTVTVAGKACRHIEWFTDAHEGALNTTTDVAGLLAKLDRDFQLVEGGQWSNAGYTVPANTVFWTDLLNHELPPQVERIRTQGNWGVYKTSAGYTVPSPNGGGRFLQVCEDTVALLAQVDKASIVTVKPADKTAVCITADEVSGILKATDPVVAYNAFFEGKGYQFGKGLNPGDKIGAGFYHGTFPQDAVPSTVTNLANGFLWRVNAETVVQGGRVMTECKK